MTRITSVLTVSGAVVLAALTLQPKPFSMAGAMQDQPGAQQRAPQLAAEMVDRWLDVAAEIDPERAEQLRAMCDRDPEQFDRVMRQTGRRLIGLAELKQHDPDLYQLKLQEMRIESQVEGATRRLAQAMRTGETADVQAMEEELRTWVRMQVAMSIRARGDYLRRLQEHMQRLEEEIDREARNFEQTVETRLQGIIDSARTIVASDAPAAN